jgi:ABC-type polysaccharide/polyol phosphate export permease
MRINVVYSGIFVVAMGFVPLIATAPTIYYPLAAFLSFMIFFPVGIIIAIIGVILKKKQNMLGKSEKKEQ